MNPQVPDELISAYFDGEVTPEERAAVEHLLAGSDEAQRELSETARLSALLHSFPRESAPVALAGNILQQTSQMPLPSVPAVAVPRPSSRKVWIASAISSLLTAACLLVVSTMMGPRPESAVAVNGRIMPTGTPAGEMAKVAATDPVTMPPGEPTAPAMVMSDESPAQIAPQKGSGARGALGGAKQTDSKPGAAPLPETVAESSVGGFAAKKSLSAVRKAGEADGVEMLQNADKDKRQIELDNAALNDLQIDNYANLLTNQSFVDKLRVGEIITFVPQVADPDNTVGVVDLAVVDILRGEQTIQILLKKNEIEPIVVKRGADTPKADKKRSDDDLVLVFIRASGDQLAKALTDIDSHPDLFRSWSSQLPLQLASNDDLPVNNPDVNLDKAPQQKETPAAKPSERPSSQEEMETAEAQLVAAKLVERVNSFNGANPAQPSFASARGNENLNGQMQANRSLDRSGNTANVGRMADRQRYSMPAGKGDYQVLHVPVNNSAQQLSNMNRSFQQYSPNTVESRRGAQGPTVAQSVENTQQRAEPKNRALRMLLVLHPAPAETKTDK